MIPRPRYGKSGRPRVYFLVAWGLLHHRVFAQAFVGRLTKHKEVEGSDPQRPGSLETLELPVFLYQALLMTPFSAAWYCSK